MKEDLGGFENKAKEWVDEFASWSQPELFG